MRKVFRGSVLFIMSIASLMGGCDSDSDGDGDDIYRPVSGTLVLDLTQKADADWFMEHSQPFYWQDNANADKVVFSEWREGVGVCVAVSEDKVGVSIATIQNYVLNSENYWGTGNPLPPRPDAGDGACDSCAGITIPYFLPKRMQVTMSSINVTEDNRAELFPNDAVAQEKMSLSFSLSRGFVGLLTRVPAREDNTNILPDNITGDTLYEFAYIRPANGDVSPGSFDGGNPYTAVQYGATYFEWFVTRFQAFDGGEDKNGQAIVLPVFEGTAEMEFGDTDVASLATDTNTIELTFDDSDKQKMSVNGVNVISNVTGESFDRTFLGGYTPNNSAQTMAVMYVGDGIYGCVRRIEIEL